MWETESINWLHASVFYQIPWIHWIIVSIKENSSIFIKHCNFNDITNWKVVRQIQLQYLLTLMMVEIHCPVIAFLGGLSLHLNHLIGSRVTNYDWLFGTLLLGLFGSNLDTRDLETYPRTYSDHFWHMSLFDDSRAVWVFLRKWVVSENQSFLDEGAIVTHLIDLVLGGQVPRLSHGPIWLAGQNT